MTLGIQRQFKQEARREREARLIALKEFTKSELKISSEKFNKIGIENIFPPAKFMSDFLHNQQISYSIDCQI